MKKHYGIVIIDVIKCCCLYGYSELELRRFKNTIRVPEELALKIITWIGQMIELRTKTLLDQKYTNAYYRAVELIIAYGEMLESRGDIGARARIANTYLSKYKRYNRFTREMKARL